MARGIAVAACAALALSASVAEASPTSRARTAQGYARAYNLEFERAYAAFAEAAADDPRDPAPPRAEAAVVWMETLFSQGAGTFEAFTGEISKSDVHRPAVPPPLAARFRAAIDEAAARAAHPAAGADPADINYQVGATAAVEALYVATVEGRTLGAFADVRRAVKAMERVRELAPGRREPGLVIGLSQYTVSTMAWPARAIARLSGLSGDRQAGRALLEDAAAPGAETEADASLILMLIDAREARMPEAAARLARLHGAFPPNRILALNLAVAKLLSNQPVEAERLLAEGVRALTVEPQPFLLGEAAMWRANRGAALIRLNRPVEAVRELRQGLASQPRDWVCGRMHELLAEVAVNEGNRTSARRELEAAVDCSRRGGDLAAASRENQQLRALGR